MKCFVSDNHVTAIKESFFRDRLDSRDVHPRDWFLLLTHDELDFMVRVVAHKLNSMFSKEIRPVLIIGLLKGVFMFMGDITRHLAFPYELKFVSFSSYVDNEHLDEAVYHFDFEAKDVNDRKIILLDELFDTGMTLETMRKVILSMKGCTLARTDIVTCTLFAKNEECRKYPEPDVVGLDTLPNWWLVGYGLDDSGIRRGWGHLFARGVGFTVEKLFKGLPPKSREGRSPEGKSREDILEMWRGDQAEAFSELREVAASLRFYR
ncbi:hypothetical protein ADUPG1_010787 [Aduncisulcus paluster]|uniref:Phosphoribosyltransferase domain-containing protein n=1 Tax=Aduncisulcus paluster TaxID=2918883 RepID=A0ABQ5JVL2_9EUKA|nr:hypothetical protein ADUPG1_010787 [Aduncisulcus paluster]|eukprot:gnl/Carplike_NY0171/2600_a3490_785.p1 GENE.gnl/Carplike_NY0171/2600_a3490_785~~gnl/Carplike_NY0171/2600_a3490_785.p1  ORF type:complete len:264 (+),score=45.33 gnl/Carplike_NY0171/2600_a3490_785:62-853(+)